MQITITVNLSIYFHDHRSLAKIFINKRMKYIKDVEYHISEIFNIHNFYLKCQNVYLPPTEDVQILNDDDLVWVIPVEKHVEFGKQKSLEKTDLSPDISNAKKDSGRASLDSNTTTTSEDASPKDKSINVASLVNTFEKKTVELPKPLWNSANQNEKKINIVKTIIITNKNTVEEPKPVATSTDSDSPKNQILKPHDSVKNDLSKEAEECEGSDSSNTFDGASSVCNSIVAETDGRVNKRKRKRTRRRKRPENNKTEFNVDFPPPVFPLKPVVVQTSKHLRFDTKMDTGDDIPVVNEMTVKVDGPKAVHESKQAKELTNNDIVTNLESHNEKDLENSIMKQPITKTGVNKGDVITFKILRISENYTPEVSSPIVGKVIVYDAVTEQVTFEILRGSDQCVIPRGRFSIEEEEPQEENSTFNCRWADLLEPRLLFP